MTSLPRLIAERKVSVLHLDTSDLAAFLAAASRQPAKSLASLREVLCSGEPLRRPVIEAFFVFAGRVQAAIRASRGADALQTRKLQLTFLYAPDEAGTAATAFTCREDDIREVAPLGKPTHVAVYVLDRHLKPVPFGVAGEICIGGEGLARGYLNDAKATPERFRSAALQGRSGVRLFRSGDTGRLRRDGTIELVAPARGTAWIAGFRCPLIEIEEALLREPSIVECVVGRGPGLNPVQNCGRTSCRTGRSSPRNCKPTPARSCPRRLRRSGSFRWSTSLERRLAGWMSRPSTLSKRSMAI